MAWLSKNNFSPSDSLHADDLNNLANDVQAWGGNVNGGGYHLSNVIIDGYYPGTGVAQLSPLHIIPTATDYTAQLRLDSEAAGNPPRWIFIKDASTETGTGNAGSNFALEACDDSGNVIHTPIAINRASGIMTLGQQQWGANVDGGGFSLTNVNIPSVFQDPLTTKGDIVIRGAAAPSTRLPVGANGTILQADSTQPLGVKWATSPAVPTSTQVIAGAGLSGGGPLTGNVTLTANVQSVFGRTGAVALTAADITGATGVLNTRSVLAGAGMSGGGPLTADVTLNALVTSVFGRTGAVTLTAADVSAGGGVPATRQVLAGSGMSGGGALSADITLNALVTSVFGRTGAVTLAQGDIVTAGGVANTRQIITAVGSGLAGGGPLSADLNLSVVSNTSVQKVNVFSNVAVGNPGSPVGTESGINFIPGNANTSISVADEGANNRVNVTITNTGSTAIWTTRGATTTLIGNRPGINLIEGSNVTFSGVDNSTSNRVDITVSAVGGTGGGASQTPWLTDVDASGYKLANVGYQGINSAVDITTRLAMQLTGTELGIRAANSSAANAARIEADNDNATAKIQLVSHGSGFGGTLQSTGGLNAAVGGMTFSIADVEAMRVSVGKHLLVGTNTDDGVEMVQVNGKIKSLSGGIVFPDGTVQTTAITSTGMNDPTTTMGDLIVRGSTVTGRLGVGTNGQVLVANSLAAQGVNWANANTATGVQSPWVGDEDAAGHNLTNLNSINSGGTKLGIGTAVPNAQLSLGANLNAINLAIYDGGAAALYGIGASGNAGGCLTFGAGIAANGTAQMALTTGGNLGIGIIGALVKLHVLDAGVGPVIVARFANSDTGGSTSEPRIVFAQGTPGAWQQGIGAPYNSGNPALTFSVNTVSNTWFERMRITSAGNVGIAQTNPLYKLSISGASLSSSQVQISYDGTDTGGYLFGGAVDFFISGGMAASNGSWVAKQTTASRISVGSSGILFHADSGLTVGGTFNPTERMRITSAGNVGIGTTSPSYALDILSNNSTQLLLHTAAGSGSQIYLGAGQAGVGGVIQFAATTAFANAVSLGNSLPNGATTNDFVFGTYTTAGGWAERMRILGAGSGNVGIGSSAPATRLEVCTASANTGINVTPSGGSYGLLVGEDAAGQAVSVYHGPNYGYVINVLNAPLILGANNAANVAILPSGNVGIGTMTPAAVLDVVGTVRFGTIPTTAPAAGSKQIWADPADGYRLKLAN